ncbi:MAG: tripartite tricarboxylate transporter permease [Proteobacteria bacterium]|nr:tripartite tricarboxylate transporter permease [Pseudomonadota bacterium]
MNLLNSLWQGFGGLFNPTNLMMLFTGCLSGLLVGALPGISAVNGIALMLPLIYAFNLSPESALILLAGIYYGSEYGSNLSSILLNIPGKSIHLTNLDGSPMAQKGLAGKALILSGFASFSGCMLAVIGLTICKPLLKNVVSGFGPSEYVAIIMFVFFLVLVMFGTSLVKNLVGLCLGLTLAIVGLDSATGVLRFAFDTPELYDGIDFIIVVIGLFTLGDALLIIENTYAPRQLVKKVIVSFQTALEGWQYRWTFLRCSLVGFVIGSLPGTGTSVAGVTAYRLEKELKNKMQTFGKGDERGVIASESAGSAASVSAFIPLLVLGIPGSATTAVLLGAMLMMNLNPGPMFYIQQSDLIWILVASMYIGNLLLFALHIITIRFFSRIVLIPYWILIPFIVVVAFVGVYAIQQSMLSLFIMLVLGLVSYLLRKLDYSLVPVILGYILGGPLEVQLRRALAISGGEIGILYQGGVNLVLWGCIVILVLFKLCNSLRLLADR